VTLWSQDAQATAAFLARFGYAPRASKAA